MFSFLSRHRPLVVNNDGSLITYSKGSIFLISSTGIVIKKICSLPTTRLFGFLSHFRLFERLLRLEPRCAVFIISEQVLLSFRGSCFRVDLQHGKVQPECNFRQGMSNPLYFSLVRGVKGLPESILYGDYWSNSNLESVRVYSRGLKGNTAWNILTEFPPGEVTHIHNIISDIKRNRILIFTGDANNESGIWEYRIGDVKPKSLVRGEQLYRACSGYVYNDDLYYATDTPQEENFLVKLCLDTLAVEKLGSLEGPIIYSAKLKNSFIFSSSVEADTNLKGINYLLSRRKGLGIKSNDSVVYSFNGIDILEIGRFKKDLYPMGLFQFGNVSFYTSENSAHTYAYGMSLSNLDGKILKFD
jgi:hypothetical protein